MVDDFLERSHKFFEIANMTRPDLALRPVMGIQNLFVDPVCSNAGAPELFQDDRFDLIEIDRYLGAYFPERTAIELYPENIETVANCLGVQINELTHIVRIHEYAHAFVHLQCGAEERSNFLRLLINDEEEFKAVHSAMLNARNKQFAAIESVVHEQIAQLSTYHLCHSLSVSHDTLARKVGAQLLDAFEKLEARQPPAYRVGRYKDSPLERLQSLSSLMWSGAVSGSASVWNTLMAWK